MLFKRKVNRQPLYNGDFGDHEEEEEKEEEDEEEEEEGEG